MIKKVIFILFAFLFLPLTAMAAEQKFQVKAAQAVLYDMDTGLVLWEKNMHRQAHPASLTKIATVITGLKFADRGQSVLVSTLAGNLNTGSTLCLKAGDKISFADLLKAAMVISANDATIAIAEATAGDLELFLQLMNGIAYTLGLQGSNFTNTHGLSVANHRISPYDLAVWSALAMKEREFQELAALQETEISIERNGKAKKLAVRNTNRLLFSNQGIYGIKTGTTSLAGKCLAGAWTAQGHHLIGIVLNSSDRWGDMLRLKDFSEKMCKPLQLSSDNQEWQRIRLQQGKGQEINVISKNNLEILIPESEINKISKRIYILPGIKLPVKTTTPIGKVQFWFGEQYIGQIELYSDRDIVSNFWSH